MYYNQKDGEVSEWSKVPDSKSGVQKPEPRVQIPPSPPERNCTHPWSRNLGCVFFFLQDSFGLVLSYKKPDIEPSENWKNLDRDDLGRFLKK